MEFGKLCFKCLKTTTSDEVKKAKIAENRYQDGTEQRRKKTSGRQEKDQ